MLKKVKELLEEHKYKLLGGVSFGLAAYAFYKYSNDDTRIKLSAFFEALQSKQLDQVVVKGDTAYFRSAVSDWYHTNLGNYPLHMLFNQLRGTPGLKFTCENQDPVGKLLLTLAITLVTTAITTRILMPQKFGTINKFPKIINNHETFENFYGSEEIKLKLKEIVEYLKNKQTFQKLGGRIRKGILLHGPPGTGKTMLAKTLANEVGLPFIQTCASQFEEIYVGVGPKKIRDIFHRAKGCPQGCIIFIDELDAIGSRSEGIRFSRETTATINQLLTELDGFEENQNVVVIGATNRVDLVDSALIRAGRFDIKLRLHLPNKDQRLGILNTLLAKKNVPHQLSQNVKLEVGEKSQGWSGADLQTLINEAVYKAIRQQRQQVHDQNMEQALREMLAK